MREASNPPPVAEAPYVILLTDRRQLGGCLRLVYRSRGFTTERGDLALRFPTRRKAERWLKKLPVDHRIKRLFSPTVDTL